MAVSCSMQMPSRRSFACAFTLPIFVTSVKPSLAIIVPAILITDSIERARSASMAIHVKKFLKHSALCLGRWRSAPSRMRPMPIA